MTIDEMISKFEENLKKLVEDIRETDSSLTVKKEEYFKLIGAIEGLRLAKQEQGGEAELNSGQVEKIENRVA